MELMMQNVFTVVKGERSYSFIAPHGAPYGEAIDSCFEILVKLNDMQKDSIDKMKSSDDSQIEVITPEMAN
jgi:hypothetical protein